MDFLKITARVAFQSHDEDDLHDRTGVIKKTPGKDEWCVESEKKDSDWSGGCFDSKSKAKDRLHQVEFFKHKNASSNIKVHITETGDNQGTVEVTYDGRLHKGTWIGQDPETFDGPSVETDDDHDLLMGALNAWGADNEFEITPEELSELSGGWWSP